MLDHPHPNVIVHFANTPELCFDQLHIRIFLSQNVVQFMHAVAENCRENPNIDDFNHECKIRTSTRQQTEKNFHGLNGHQNGKTDYSLFIDEWDVQWEQCPELVSPKVSVDRV